MEEIIVFFGMFCILFWGVIRELERIASRLLEIRDHFRCQAVNDKGPLKQQIKDALDLSDRLDVDIFHRLVGMRAILQGGSNKTSWHRAMVETEVQRSLQRDKVMVRTLKCDSCGNQQHWEGPPANNFVRHVPCNECGEPIQVETEAEVEGGVL